MRRLIRVFVVLAALAAIVVPVAMAMAFEEGKKPPAGTVGTPYSYTFVVYGGCPPYDFVVHSGALPAGLSLSSSGTISGTPTAAGLSTFWVQLRDTGCGPSATCPPAGISCSTPAERPFTISITAKLTVTTASLLGHATVGTPYAVKLTADGGGSQTWSLASGALPAGLTLAADGTLSGTPTTETPSPVTFTVKVTDGSRSDTKNLQLDVVKAIAVTAGTLPTGEVGIALKPTKVAAAGGRAPYAWALSGQPSWVTFDADVGIGGTPPAAGTFPLQVSVTDVYGTVATTNLVLVVKNKVAVKTAKLPVTKVGRSYRWLLRTAGGVAPFTWKVTAGKFPVGIRLDRKTGVLSGIPRKSGTYPLTFMVKDSLGATSEVSLTLNILPVKKKK